MEVSKKEFGAFALLDALYWAFFASSVGFLTTYMLACGLSNSILSIVLAIYMFCAFLGAFFWGGLCDKLKSNKKVFIPEFAAAGVLALIIFFMASRNIWVSACLYPVLGFLLIPLGSNLDSWMLRNFNQSGETYGKARAMGSVGFAVTMLILGNLINSLGYIVQPIAIILFSVLVVLLGLWMREKRFEVVMTMEAVTDSGSLKDLFKIKPYMFVLIILFLVGLSISPVNNLKIVFLQSVGGDVSMLGLDSFIGVMVQALFIFGSGLLKRIPVNLRLFLIPAFVLGTHLMNLFAVTPYMIIAGTVLNNVSYGIMLPTQREITEYSVPYALKNRAHSLGDAMYSSFSGMMALLYSGILIDNFGARSVALLGVIIMIIPVIMTIKRMIANEGLGKRNYD